MKSLLLLGFSLIFVFFAIISNNWISVAFNFLDYEIVTTYLLDNFLTNQYFLSGLTWALTGLLSFKFTNNLFTEKIKSKKNLHLKQYQTGFSKEIPVGFSWTTFFFTFLVPFYRGDISRGIMFLFLINIPTFIFYIGVIFNSGILVLIGILILVFISIILGFKYNNIYYEFLCEKGFIGVREKKEAA